MLAESGGERRTLQGLATAVWVVLDEPMTEHDIVEALIELGAVPDGVDDEVVSTLELLVHHGVVEPVPGVGQGAAGGDADVDSGRL